MVRQLIELTKLEYEKREFNNRTFNIVELEKEIVRTSKLGFQDANYTKTVKVVNFLNPIDTL